MYRIFISHSWSYPDHYYKIEEFLDQERVPYYNHSVPKDDPIHTSGSDWELEAKIEAKIKGCSCVVILEGVYASYSKWIDKEVKLARKYAKPIIAVRPWGAERVSALVRNSATIEVGWNAKSVADAIRRYSLNV
jgi:hypothetical protein